jgi:hypothetical protein
VTGLRQAPCCRQTYYARAENTDVHEKSFLLMDKEAEAKDRYLQPSLDDTGDHRFRKAS